MSLDVSLSALRQTRVYEDNITHNLAKMAIEAGIYHALWCPGENGLYKAQQLIRPLERGLGFLKADREKFEQFNPPNGWGSYDALVRFVEQYLEACRENPDADVRTSR